MYQKFRDVSIFVLSKMFQNATFLAQQPGTLIGTWILMCMLSFPCDSSILQTLSLGHDEEDDNDTLEVLSMLAAFSCFAYISSVVVPVYVNLLLTT